MSEENVVTEPQASGTELGNSTPEPKQEVSAAAETPKENVPRGTSDGNDPAAPPAYTPNYKFKVHDEEKEFDEFMRSAIKDADTEKKARELYEKAYGLDHVKPKYEDLKKKYPEVETKFKELDSTVNAVLDLKDKDLGLFFEALRLPEEKVAEWMLAKIKKMDLPPEQRQVYDQLEETRRRNMALEKQFQEAQISAQQQAVQARTLELETILNRPEVSSVVATYDAARKKPGAFKELVQRHGITEWKVNNRDVSAEDATSEVMSWLGDAYRTANPAAPNLPVVEKPLPVLPRIGGKAVSPAGKQVKSIADLKRLRSEMVG